MNKTYLLTIFPQDLGKADTGRILGRTRKGYSAGSTGELLWDTQQDTRRDPLAGCVRCCFSHGMSHDPRILSQNNIYIYINEGEPACCVNAPNG